MSLLDQSSLSRRRFIAATVATPFVAALSAASRPMVGLELFSVRQDLAADLFGTVRRVAKAGYEAVEFFSPYYQWEPAYAKQVRQLLDEVRQHPSCQKPSGRSRSWALLRSVRGW